MAQLRAIAVTHYFEQLGIPGGPHRSQGLRSGHVLNPCVRKLVRNLTRLEGLTGKQLELAPSYLTRLRRTGWFGTRTCASRIKGAPDRRLDPVEAGMNFSRSDFEMQRFESRRPNQPVSL